jgi:hypothetical protein
VSAKKPQRRLTPAQAQQRLEMIARELETLAAAYDLSNGAIRLRIRKLHRETKELLGRFPQR